MPGGGTLKRTRPSSTQAACNLNPEKRPNTLETGIHERRPQAVRISRQSGWGWWWWLGWGEVRPVGGAVIGKLTWRSHFHTRLSVFP